MRLEKLSPIHHVRPMSQGTADLATKPSPDFPPDFRHVDAWLFDLDNTLYEMDAAAHAVIEERICIFVQRHFDLPREPAFKIQKQYLFDYGSTLAGLVKHDGVDADAYHDFVNDLDALRLKPDPALRESLTRLPGRRLVFTNNCGRFARTVLERVGIDGLFDDIVDARTTDFVPKPQAGAYETLLRRGVVAKRAALFDDSARNLLQAHALGMTTVWFNNGFGHAKHGALHDATSRAHIHYETAELAPFLNSIRI
jgi:putative hydrolase of the HAD superfamily